MRKIIFIILLFLFIVNFPENPKIIKNINVPINISKVIINKPEKLIKIHYTNKVIVLIYHHITEQGEKSETISSKQFTQNLEILKNNDYNIIKMDDFIKFMTMGTPVLPNAVIITFDDGYESFYTYAYPELLKFNATATNFIIVKSSDNALLSQHIPHLNWDEMREMKKNGMSFYSHTYDLHFYQKIDNKGNKSPALSSQLYLEEQQRIETEQEYFTRIKNDFDLAQKRIQNELGIQDELLAFPYGYYNEDVIKIGKEFGTQLFFTTNEGINESGKNLIFRINAGTNDINSDVLINKLKKYDVCSKESKYKSS